MNLLRKRLDALEESANPDGRVRYLLRWSSQDHEEALDRWKANLADRGDPLLPSDHVYCVVWQDPDGRCANDWSTLRAPSYRTERRGDQ